MNKLDMLIDNLRKFTKVDTLFVCKKDIKNNNLLKIELYDSDWCVYLNKDCDYITVYLIKQIVQLFINEYEKSIESENNIAYFKGIVKELLDASKSYANEGFMESKSFQFLGEQVNCSIIKNDIVVFNNGIDKYTLDTSLLKLEKQDEFSMLVKEGEVYGCKTQNYKVILYSENIIDDIVKNALKVRLIFLNKLYENEVNLKKIKNINSMLENLVTLRTKEIENKNKMLEEEKRKLTKLNKKLNQLSKIDSLTKLANRRGLREKFSFEANKLKKKNSSISLIMADIDFFKSVNDTYGHDCGDMVLVRISELLRNNLRSKDIISRYGGEEFVIVLPDVDYSYSILIAENLRSVIEKEIFEYNGSTFNVTMSFGVLNLNDKISFRECMKKVDTALYAAKENGRNKVITI